MVMRTRFSVTLYYVACLVHFPLHHFVLSQRNALLVFKVLLIRCADTHAVSCESCFMDLVCLRGQCCACGHSDIFNRITFNVLLVLNVQLCFPTNPHICIHHGDTWLSLPMRNTEMTANLWKILWSRERGDRLRFLSDVFSFIMRFVRSPADLADGAVGSHLTLLEEWLLSVPAPPTLILREIQFCTQRLCVSLWFFQYTATVSFSSIKPFVFVK